MDAQHQYEHDNIEARPQKTKAAPKSQNRRKKGTLVPSSGGDALHRYLGEVGRHRLLTRQEEHELAVRFQTEGDKEAAYLLVVSNLRLVVKIAMEFQRVWLNNLMDLIQEGNIGLLQAVKKFDPYRNIKFSYYSAFWIKAYILKFIMDNWRMVKLGTTQAQRKLFYRLEKEKDRLSQQGFEPGPKLLAEKLGVSQQDILDMDQRLTHADVSLDAPLRTDSETERIELLPAQGESIEDQVAQKELDGLLHEKLKDFRKTISRREREILDERIFSEEPLTLQELGKRFGISRERIRQVEGGVVNKLKSFFQHQMPDYLDHVVAESR